MPVGQILLGATGEEIVLSSYGRSLTIKSNEYSRQTRTANCRLVKDIKEGSPKKTFTLSYSLIDGDALDHIETIYNLQSELSLIIYTSDFVYDQYTVLMEPLQKGRFLIAGDGLWSNVKVELNEV